MPGGAAANRLGAVLALVLMTAALVASPAVARGGPGSPGLVASPSAALPTEDKATRFHVDVELTRDGSAHVTENITWTFPSDQERHGIERLIKVRAGYQDRKDTFRVYEMSDVSARSTTGAPAEVSVSEFGAYDRIRVGRPDETVSGTQSYVVSYTLANYVNGFADHAEFYFNLVDPSNENTYENVSASVHGPEPVDRVDCFYGELGSTSRCQATAGETAQFSAGTVPPVRASRSWPPCRAPPSTPSSPTCARARSRTRGRSSPRPPPEPWDC